MLLLEESESNLNYDQMVEQRKAPECLVKQRKPSICNCFVVKLMVYRVALHQRSCLCVRDNHTLLVKGLAYTNTHVHTHS